MADTTGGPGEGGTGRTDKATGDRPAERGPVVTPAEATPGRDRESTPGGETRGRDIAPDPIGGPGEPGRPGTATSRTSTRESHETREPNEPHGSRESHASREPHASRLLPHDECDKLALRLQHAVAGFVDGPRSAVEEVASRFTDAVKQRRRTLRTSWQAGDAGEGKPATTTDTEQLRLALRDYRELADRLLRL